VKKKKDVGGSKYHKKERLSAGLECGSQPCRMWLDEGKTMLKARSRQAKSHRKTSRKNHRLSWGTSEERTKAGVNEQEDRRESEGCGTRW